MYCKFQVYQNGTWSNFGSVISPLRIGDTITTDTTTSYSIMLYMKGATEISIDSLTPGTICRINFGTRIFWLVVVDGGKVEPSVGADFCYHTYNCQELLCYLREVFVQTSFFSYDSYTVEEFFTRLFAMSKIDMPWIINSGFDYQTLLDNWKRAEYQAASNSLLDNLIKIGQINQVRAKAAVDNSGNLEISFRNLRGTDVLNSINGELTGYTQQYSGANYASKVIAQVENMTADSEFWFPEDDNVIGILAEPDGDSIQITSNGELVLVLPYNIKSASQVKIIGFGNIVESEFGSITKDRYGNILPGSDNIFPGYWEIVNTKDYRNTTGVVVNANIVQYEEWRQLHPDSSLGATIHQKNTLYFKRGENKIYNIQICDGVADGDDDRLDSDYIYQQYDGSAWVEYKQKLIASLNYYVVKCSLYHNGIVESRNKKGTNRSVMYTQEDNHVSGKNLLMNMQGYIDSMQNKDISRTYRFASIADVPNAGDIYNGMVIASVMMSCQYDSIDATLVMSDDVVKKSEYISADAGVELFGIPSLKSYERFTNYEIMFWFARTQSEAQSMIDKFGEDTYLNNVYVQYALDSAKNGRSLKALVPAEILLAMGEYEEDPVYSALNASVRIVNQSIIISWSTKDNVLAGTFIDTKKTEVFTDFVYLPVNYINAPGFSKYSHIKVLPDSVRSTEANFPRIADATFSGAWPLIEVWDQEYYHDPAEILKGAIQITDRQVNDEDEIREAFLTECSLVKDTLNKSDLYTRYVHASGYTAEITNVTLTTVSSKLYRLDVFFTSSSIPAGSNQDVTISRKNNTGYTYESMLKMKLAITTVSGDNKKVSIYVAVTK